MTLPSASSQGFMQAYERSCPDDDALARYVDGMLPPREWSALEAHLHRCSNCACLVGAPWQDASADLLRSRLVATSITGVDAPLPEQFGRYRVDSVLGAGAMGTVFRAHDPELNRDVAIKCMRISSSSEIHRLQLRLKAEAQLLARRGDPRVVELYDVGEQAGVLFIVMEYVRGRTLRQWSEGVGAQAIVAAMTSAAEVLAHLHGDGLVHGDFKPDNMLVEESGRVRILDFGLARLFGREGSTLESDDASEPRDGSPGPGTPAYMAPELLRGGLPTPAGDQYAWSVTLFELLTGQRPYPATSLAALREQADAHAIVWRGIGRRARRVITRGLAPEAGERFASLDAAARGLRTRPLLGIAVGTLALGLATLGLTALWLATDASPDAVESCVVDADALERWSPGATAQLEQRIAQLGIEGLNGPMVATRLDAYAQRWRRHAALACLPVGARGDALRSCLSSAAVAYGHAIALLRDGQERTVRRTASVLARLPSPEACFRSPGGGVEQGPVADALRARLARVQNLQIVAQTRDAYALALETYELAGASHLPRLEARAALAIAISAPTTGEESPKQWLHRAHELAVACGDDHIATGASLSLISEHVRRRDFDGARRWIRHAEGYLGETGHPRQRATLNARIGHLHRAEGDLDQALEYARKVLEAYVDFDGPHSLEASKSRVAFGHALLAAGRYEEAKVPLETAIADLVPKFGETHAVVATACNGRGGASYFLGEYATAVKYYERSIAIRRDLNGRDSLQVATLESNLGGVLTDRGDHTAAIATLRHANAVMTEHYGPDDLRLVDVWLNLGRALSIAGHDEAGLKILWRAATLYEGRGDATATQRGLIDLNLGEAYERQARIATAVEHYVRAHELFRTRLGDDHPNTKEAADALARIQRP